MIPFNLLLSPLVVAQRMPALWWEAMGGNPFGPRESSRMVSEKLDAAQLGTAAAQRAMIQTSIDATHAAMTGRPVEAIRLMMTAPGRVTEAALKPAANRVGANVRRLAKG
jgi:hypothetical protein